MDIYLPTLHSFAMKNTFTGSCGMLRFRIVPSVVMNAENPKEVDFQQSSMTAQLWHGMFCFEKSEVEKTETFPLSEEGRTAMKIWLEENI